MTKYNNDKVFVKDFLFTSFSSFSFFSSFYLLLPIIPLYVIARGGSASDVGLVLGLFPLASIIARPFVGVFADIHGRKLYMLIGAVIFTISALLYSITGVILALLAIRLFHGLGMAAFTTSSSAFIADIVPKTRRGEAMSYFATANNIALVIGPYVALSMVASGGGYQTVFFAGAALAFLSIVLVLPVRENLQSTAEVQKIFDPALLRRDVVFPSLVIGIGALTYAAIIAFLPIHAQKIGLGNPGIFFTAYGVSIIGSRIIGSRLIDKYPREYVIIFSAILMLIGVALLAFTSSIIQLVGVAILYGMGLAFLLPAAQVFLIDRVRKEERAKALGVFFSFLELGIGGGAIILGIVAEYLGYQSAFLVSSVIGAIGISFFYIGIKRQW